MDGSQVRVYTQIGMTNSTDMRSAVHQGDALVQTLFKAVINGMGGSSQFEEIVLR